jgi:hypothetical protein
MPSYAGFWVTRLDQETRLICPHQMTGIGPVLVKVRRVRDRAAVAEKVRFTSSILPPYLRKAKSVEELLPWLYLKGFSSGQPIATDNVSGKVGTAS